MNMQAYIDEIKLSVTGGLLELEIDDSVISKLVNSAMRELQRYICSTKIVTLPYSISNVSNMCFAFSNNKSKSFIIVFLSYTLFSFVVTIIYHIMFFLSILFLKIFFIFFNVSDI